MIFNLNQFLLENEKQLGIKISKFLDILNSKFDGFKSLKHKPNINKQTSNFIEWLNNTINTENFKDFSYEFKEEEIPSKYSDPTKYKDKILNFKINIVDIKNQSLTFNLILKLNYGKGRNKSIVSRLDFSIKFIDTNFLKIEKKLYEPGSNEIYLYFSRLNKLNVGKSYTYDDVINTDEYNEIFKIFKEMIVDATTEIQKKKITLFFKFNLDNLDYLFTISYIGYIQAKIPSRLRNGNIKYGHNAIYKGNTLKTLEDYKNILIIFKEKLLKYYLNSSINLLKNENLFDKNKNYENNYKNAIKINPSLVSKLVKPLNVDLSDFDSLYKSEEYGLF